MSQWILHYILKLVSASENMPECRIGVKNVIKGKEKLKGFKMWRNIHNEIWRVYEPAGKVNTWLKG